jgi:hypothetical protein
MKNTFLTILMVVATIMAYAQNTKSDSTKQKKDSTRTIKKEKNFKIGFNQEEDNKNSDNKNNEHSKYPKFSAYFTFARFDLGFTTIIDNGSFTLSPQNQFLSYRQSKTSTVGFDLFQVGVRFSDNFKINLAGGFDWTLIRLRENITILPHQPVLTFRPDSINYSKNRFSSNYLRIPLSFDFRTKADENGNRFHFVLGPEVGFLLDGMVKQISAEHGKQKISDSYHFATLRYGGFVRIGYGDFGVFAKYYANDMFENSPQQAGLKNFSFGLTVAY